MANPRKPLDLQAGFALIYGLFLGLGLLKFGNPIILHHRIDPPGDFNEWLIQPWPLTWSIPIVLALTAFAWVVWRRLPPPDSSFKGKRGESDRVPTSAMEAAPPPPSRRASGKGGGRWFQPRLLLGLPMAWLAWQTLAAWRSVDASLALPTWLHLLSVVWAYAVGYLILGRLQSRHWIWLGLGAGLMIGLIRATNQRWVEFPQLSQFLTQGDADGWTEADPRDLEDLIRSGLLMETNGLPRANPLILAKLEKSRVHGTLVYPNAQASALLLLCPPLLAWLARHQSRLRPLLRHLVWILVGGLMLGVFYWTGSKAAFLVALPLAAWFGVRRGLGWDQPLRSRHWLILAGLVLIGFLGFYWRFAGYFQAGATSASARFDYWRAALQITGTHPLTGTGPGTFQRPYAEMKPQDAEMTRLVHNDYLQQFSDSGIPGGLLYGAWLGSVVLLISERLRHRSSIKGETPSGSVWVNPVQHGLLYGLVGWFLHGFFEFSLYVPALAWCAFSLLGMVLREMQSAAREFHLD